MLVERPPIIFRPPPAWRKEAEERIEKWHEGSEGTYSDEVVKTFFAPKQEPRDTLMRAIDRVLAAHEHDQPDDAVRCLQRRPSSRLFLVTKTAGGEWSFPRVEMRHTDGSVEMREVLKRALATHLGTRLKVFHYSRSPLAHAVRGDGAVDFFFRMDRVVGDVDVTRVPADEPAEGDLAPADDHAWVSEEEALDWLPEDLHSVAKVLLRPV